MKGQIVKIHSDLHYVQVEKDIYPCKCRGIFRKEKILPLVGDYVEFDSKKLVVENVLPRKNEFRRPKVSNIDQAVIVTSCKSPDFSANLLDKLLVVLEYHHMKPIICFTKKDLLTKAEKKEIKQIKKYYEKIGYTVLWNTNISKIKRLFKNKTTVFTGQTGAGKSSLLNKLNKNLKLETGEISKALGRGKHTTRHVELIELFKGKVLDTPGFSSIDFSNMKDTDIRDSFIEFKKYACPFQDCMHLKEKECSVKEAVKKGNILMSRYQDYQNFVSRK